MTDDEYEGWSAANLAAPSAVRASHPCLDCTPVFAIAAIAEKRCDGPMRHLNRVELLKLAQTGKRR